MLSTFLSKYPGFEIFEAENGKEGLRLPVVADRAGMAKLIAEHIWEKLDIPEDIKQKIVFGAQLHEIGGNSPA